VDIRGGSVGRGPQTTVWWSEAAIFHNFGRHIFGTLRVEASIIMRRHISKCLIGYPGTLK